VARRISLLEWKIELVSIPQPVDLSRKEADVFLSFFNPHLSGLSSRKIGHFVLFLYCAPSYATAHGLPTSREDLAQHVFVDYIEASWRSTRCAGCAKRSHRRESRSKVTASLRSARPPRPGSASSCCRLSLPLA
jgi:DNA-binding transcriptional LysR family regulator